MTSMTQTNTKVSAVPAKATGGKDLPVGKGTVPRVVALVPRGEVIRNFVYSDAFNIVAEHADLSLISVSANAELDNWLSEKFGDVFPLREIREKWIVRILREIIDIAHGRWLWSKAAQERWRMREVEASTFKRKAKRFIKKSMGVPFSNRTGLRVLSFIERTASKALRNNDEYRDLLERVNPSLVFNGSHVHSNNAIQAVQAAQWLGIPTATFIFSWDNLTSQGRILLPYDYYIVWNEALKRQLLEMYDWISPENVYVTGTPQFDFHFRPEFYRSREEFCKGHGLNPERPVVLYSTGMANHMPGEPEIVEQIADILKDAKGSPQLLVRVYPKDRTNRFEELRKRRKDIIFPKIAWHESWLTPDFEDSFDLVNTLRHVEFGINIASTISLELCMFDKPAINVGYNPPSVPAAEKRFADYYNFDHYRPLVESGAIEVAWNIDEMRALVDLALREPSRRSEERRSLIENFFGGTLDGRSAERVAQLLLELSAKHRNSDR